MLCYKLVTLIQLLLLIITSTEALECSILLNATNKDLAQVIATCLIPTIPVVEDKPENTTQVTNTTNEDDPEEPSAYDVLNFFPNFFQQQGPRRGLRVRRETRDNNENKTLTATTSSDSNSTKSTHSITNTNTGTTNDQSENPNDPARCVVHCIMSSYNMIGAKGFPELTKVAASLLKDIANRELRDFLQDAVDECFQVLSESIEIDSCTYSARLSTCLADKARFNCSDWPVGELPFPHKF